MVSSHSFWNTRQTDNLFDGKQQHPGISACNGGIIEESEDDILLIHVHASETVQKSVWRFQLSFTASCPLLHSILVK